MQASDTRACWARGQSGPAKAKIRPKASSPEDPWAKIAGLLKAPAKHSVRAGG